MYVENFRLPTGEVANYLTDSTTFRFYVGIDDPEEKVFTYACKGDSIIIRKVTVPRQEGDRSKLLSTDIYSLRDLRRKDPIH